MSTAVGRLRLLRLRRLRRLLLRWLILQRLRPMSLLLLLLLLLKDSLPVRCLCKCTRVAWCARATPLHQRSLSMVRTESLERTAEQASSPKARGHSTSTGHRCTGTSILLCTIIHARRPHCPR